MDDVADEIQGIVIEHVDRATALFHAWPARSALIVALIAVALLFDFLNGLHDAANSIATVVSTRVLSPSIAVVWAAFFNFIAFLFFGLHVAQTIGTGLIAPEVVDWRVIFGALMGAITWNLITWWGGIPSSSSHALIGGLVGAGIAKGGVGAVVVARHRQDRRRHRLVAAARAPLWRCFCGSSWRGSFVRSTPFAVDRQLPRAAARLGRALFDRARRQRRAEDHGHHRRPALRGGHARRGILRAVLGGHQSCQAAMALGTLIGGWRIVKTMGSRITRLKPVQGFCAETGGRGDALSGDVARRCRSRPRTRSPAPSSASARRGGSRRSAGESPASIIIAWVVTLPAAALLGAVFYACAALLS